MGAPFQPIKSRASPNPLQPACYIQIEKRFYIGLFFNKFLPGLEALQYDGAELPEPLRRLAAHCQMVSTEDLEIAIS